MTKPFDALTRRAIQDNTELNWDLTSGNPAMNPVSSACLVFINAWASEGSDRPGLRDDFSDGLVKNVASKCAQTIVIIHSAGVRLVDQWIDHPNVTAVIMAHLPGQDSGQALVDIIYGAVSPSGKLPYTLARNESDYPVLGPDVSPGSLSPQSNFSEGVYLDYRHFDRQGIQPRFEFGFGLSYTTFLYSAMKITKTNAMSFFPFPRNTTSVSVGGNPELWDVLVHVQVDITNTGKMAAAEVAQLYLGIPGRPSKQLRGFQKTFIAPHATANVRFDLTRRDFSIWSLSDQNWLLQRGNYSLFVGASSRSISLTQSIAM